MLQLSSFTFFNFQKNYILRARAYPQTTVN